MRKLKLNWDELVVESFETTSASTGRGTVQGNASAFEDTCLTETDENSCPGSCEIMTCDENCGGGSWNGCGGGGSRITCVPTAPAGDTCCLQTC